LTECPACNIKFIEKNPNWALIEIAPESSYDQSRAELKQALEEGIDLKKKIEKFKESILEENLNQLNTLRQDINNKTNEMMN